MGSITAAALLLATVPTVLAVTFQVGDTAGWNSGVDYTTWVSGKTFRVGDTLEFQYGLFHSVAVVDKAGFDGCDDSGATQRFSDGNTKFDLTTVGTIHFLCPSPGHCLGGMKLAVPVLATAATPPPPSSSRTPPPSPPSPPSSTPSPPLSPRSPPPYASPPATGTPESTYLTPTPSPSTPNAASKGVMSYGMIGVTMVLIYIWSH
ncbi:Uclacyanin-3 [Cardamine amara subsp. amara]|uniref:Uclacyanin-3 n=1 Tax=Cardamine amara subsp. amara TaxID=228776 RepID=A0ABD0ZWB2_CARAN